MNKILITGGAGFIGSHTSLVLLEHGYELIIIDSLVNSSSKVINRIIDICIDNKVSINPKINLIQGDLRDEEFLKKVFKNHSKSNSKIDAVIHFAGLKSVYESTQDPLKYWDNNLKGTINLLNIMKNNDCFNIVFSSSATIYGTKYSNAPLKESSEISPVNPYGKTKATIEQILEDLSNQDSSNWNIASLRYFNPIGAHPSGLIGENPLEIPNNILPIISKVAFGLIKEFEVFGKDWPTIDGTGVRDYIHVMDLAEGHLRAVEYILRKKLVKNNINLGTGLGTSVLELLKTFEEVNDVKIPFKFTNRREGDIPFSVADNSLAKEILEWNPTRNLEDMCKDSWNWYKKNPKGF